MFSHCTCYHQRSLNYIQWNPIKMTFHGPCKSGHIDLTISLLDIKREWRFLGNFYRRGTNMHGHTLKPLLFCSHYRGIKHGSWRSQSTSFRRSFTKDIFSFKARSHFCSVKNSLHGHMGSFNSLRS